MSAPFWHSMSMLYPCLVASFLLVPRKRRQNPPKSGLEISGTPNPRQNPISRAGSGVPNPPCAERNDEGLMNSAILLVDVASARRDSWKSFLQSQNYVFFSAANGESAME